MNFYFAVGLAIIVAILCVGSAYEGHSIGVNSQKITDQKQFDKFNSDIAKQKSDAATMLSNKQMELISTALDRDILKTQLGVEHAKAAQLTNDKRNLLVANGRLQFAGSQVAGRGDSNSSPAVATASAAGNTGATACQLSESASIALRQIVFDADTLRDDYTLLYQWAHAVK